MKNLIICLLFFSSIFLKNINADEKIKILYKIDNSIVTSFDVKKEISYLKSLNKNLLNYDKNKLFDVATQSLIREKIKQTEIEKFYIMDYKTLTNSEIVNNFLRNIYKNQGFNDENEFAIYLIKNNVKIEDVKKKLVIEQHWNKLVYDIYKDSIKIDEKEIDSKLEKIIKNKSNLISFNLSEISISGKNKSDYEIKYESILGSIKEIGFKDTATIYSISDSSKIGGNIGWVNQNQLSEQIFDAIKDLKIGEFTKPIIAPGRILLLYLNNKKEISSDINKEIETEKIIMNERNRQLNEYSIIHFKKIENKIYAKKM